MIIWPIFISIFIRLSFSNEILKGNVGQNLTLPCLLENESQIAEVSFVHQRTGDLLTAGLDVLVDNNRMKLVLYSSTRLDLILYSVSENASGLYTCMCNGEELSSYFLEIFIPPRFQSFYPLEGSVSYPEGASINFSCHVYALPPANITWIYRNKNKQFRKIHDGENVYISTVRSVDSGSYECIASNGYHATISRSFYVTVQYPPRVTMNKQFLDLHTSPLELTCQICSLPFSHILWLRNEKILFSNHHKEDFLIKTDVITVHNDECLKTTLIVYDTSNDKYGRYECQAENILGHYSDHMDFHPKLLSPSPSLLILRNTSIQISDSSNCSSQLVSGLLLLMIIIHF